MRASIVARNYAEALLALAERNGGDPTIDAFASAMDMLAEGLGGDPRVRDFLATPRVDSEARKDALRKALQGRAPELFIRFVLVVVERRRAPLLPQIASAYRDLVDQARGRIRAHVLLAREPDTALRAEIVSSLEAMLRRTVVAEFEVDQDLLGGIVVRVGDRILDGSVRRRSARLRRRLLTTRIPATVGG